ncbi:MAG: hypothetical protein ACQEUZ_09605, partial [Pseudomonadota bacterium]
MTEELRLHLGDCKTGSTSIQTILKRGRWRCPSRRIAYPVEEGRLHHCLVAATLYKEGQIKNRAARWGRLARMVRDAQADVSIVSAEWFELAEPQEVKRALEEFLPEHAGSARLIAYIRPHADRLVSSFQEQTKVGANHDSLAGFHARTRKNGRFFYAPRLRRWREVFGDRYEVRPLIRERLHEGDVVRDFLRWALDGAEFEVTGAPAANVSLNLEDLALVREMHRRRPLPPGVGQRMAEALHARGGAGTTPLRMDRRLLEEVRRDYLEDAREIDAEFFEGAPFERAFDAAEAKAVDTPQTLDADMHFSAGERRRIAAFAGLAGKLADEAGLKL